MRETTVTLNAQELETLLMATVQRCKEAGANHVEVAVGDIRLSVSFVPHVDEESMR